MPQTLDLIPKEKVLQAQENWRNDPVTFSKTFFNSILWQKQQEVMCSVRDNARTAVKSGNTVGKSKIAAETILWFLITHYPSKVIITAPTFFQIETILWKEIAKLYKHSSLPIGGDLLKTELKLNEEWFAVGISTDEVNRFQGFHSKYLLVVIDEALGVASNIWEAIEGLHPYRILAIGNPLKPEGNFYKCFSSPLWNKIKITCQECVDWQNKHGKIDGLVSQQWIKERAQEWRTDNPLYIARVDAEFPEFSTDAIIKRGWVKESVNKVLNIYPGTATAKVTVADVGAEGDDDTVIYNMEGYTIKSEDISGEKDTMKSTGKIFLMANKNNYDLIAIDKIGIGQGVYDRAREVIHPDKKHLIKGIESAGKPELENKEMQFWNVRAEMWWTVAQLFADGLVSIPNDDILINDLCAPKYEIDSSGRIKIESKKDIKKRLGRSPDRGDACVMGFYAQKFAQSKKNFHRTKIKQRGYNGKGMI